MLRAENDLLYYIVGERLPPPIDWYWKLKYAVVNLSMPVLKTFGVLGDITVATDVFFLNLETMSIIHSNYTILINVSWK